MPQSPSPRISPTARNNGHQSASRLGLNGSPPTQSLSKRDKRRFLLADRLSDLTANFSNNRDNHYRQQLQALQIDMNLITSANPYSDKPLEDTGDEIANLVNIAAGGNSSTGANGGQGGSHRRLEVDTAQLAGKWYARFAEEVNNAMESRDAQLTLVQEEFDRSKKELYRDNDYKTKLAQEEHKILANTIRQRLLQVVSQRKSKLMHEKDHLDIVESNALLLHPNHFSITNPASPGGTQNNRKTRHTRHRQGDTDDTGSTAIGGDSTRRRKPRGAPEENEVGSPGPMARITGAASPLKDAKARLAAVQFEAPLFSIDRLFTEKELSMHLNTAAIAAAQYFAALKVQGNGNGTTPNGDADQNGDNTEGEDTSGSGIGTAQEGEGEDDVPPAAAPEMDRNANQSFHATRSTRNAAGAAGLNLLGDLAVSSGKSKGLLSALPIILPQSMITKTGQAPHPPGLRADDAEDDLSKIDHSIFLESGLPDKKLLDDLCIPPGTKSQSELRSAIRRVTRAAANAPTVAGLGGVSMSAQSSLAGFSDNGGIAMSRYGEGSSTGAMKRSASGAGFGIEGETGKRIKSR
ncbi:MAG: hypothetical protein M1836_005875 [Candelina mexicana]|nr:MAG: hypothetical protein M1836_005875 [Candelina mexicana]